MTDREHGPSVLHGTYPSGQVLVNADPAVAAIKSMNIAASKSSCLYSKGRSTPGGQRVPYSSGVGEERNQNVKEHPDFQLRNGEILLGLRELPGPDLLYKETKGTIRHPSATPRDVNRERSRGAQACMHVFSSLANMHHIVGDHDGRASIRQFMAQFEPRGIATEPDSRGDNKGKIAAQVLGLKSLRVNGSKPFKIGNTIRAYIPRPEELAHGPGGAADAVSGERPVVWIMPVDDSDQSMEAYQSCLNALTELERAASVGNFAKYLKGEAAFENNVTNAWFIYFHGHGLETDEFQNSGSFSVQLFNDAVKVLDPTFLPLLGDSLVDALLAVLFQNADERDAFVGREASDPAEPKSMNIISLSLAFAKSPKIPHHAHIAMTLDYLAFKCTFTRAKRLISGNPRRFALTYGRQLLALRSVNEDYSRWNIGKAVSDAEVGGVVLAYVNTVH